MLDNKLIERIKKETGEPELITEERLSSFNKFSELELPSQKAESWRYTSPKLAQLERFDEVVSQKTELVIIKGTGVIACTIHEGLKKHKELLMEHLKKSIVDVDEDKFTTMHYSFWNDGIFIFVPKNTEAQVDVKFIAEKEGAVLSHNIIVVEENASLDYFEEHSSVPGDYICFRNDTTHIFTKGNSKIMFYNFQNWDDNVIGMANWKADLAKDSCVEWVFGQFGGKFSRVKTDTMFNGQGSNSKTYGVFFADKEQHFDFTTDAYHNVPNTNCDILVKGVLDGSSSSVYRGKIKIIKGAQQTNSYLSDHSLMLSGSSISNSIPSLEIDANDVKASHGATIGKPDEEDIFYIMARGLGRKEAERLIITGYFSPVIEQIKNPEFRSRFETAIEGKKNV